MTMDKAYARLEATLTRALGVKETKTQTQTASATEKALADAARWKTTEDKLFTSMQAAEVGWQHEIGKTNLATATIAESYLLQQKKFKEWLHDLVITNAKEWYKAGLDDSDVQKLVRQLVETMNRAARRYNDWADQLHTRMTNEARAAAVGQKDVSLRRTVELGAEMGAKMALEIASR